MKEIKITRNEKDLINDCYTLYSNTERPICAKLAEQVSQIILEPEMFTMLNALESTIKLHEKCINKCLVQDALATSNIIVDIKYLIVERTVLLNR